MHNEGGQTDRRATRDDSESRLNSLRKDGKRGRIQAAAMLDTAVCSTIVESENNLDSRVRESPLDVTRRHRRRRKSNERASRNTEAEDEQPDKLFPQGKIQQE